MINSTQSKPKLSLLTWQLGSSFCAFVCQLDHEMGEYRKWMQMGHKYSTKKYSTKNKYPTRHEQKNGGKCLQHWICEKRIDYV
jgi:hypothetical protein